MSTLRHALAWAMDHDPAMALRLALAQEQWWQIRGRLTSQAPLLAAVAEHADVGSDEWCAVRMCLGQAAGQLGDSAAALEHFTAVRDALEDTRRPASEAGPVLLSICLDGRSSTLLGMGRVDEAIDDGRRALDLARETGFPGLEAMALACLSGAAWQQRRPGRRPPARAPGAADARRDRRRAAADPQPDRDGDTDRGRRPGRRRADLHGSAGLEPGSGRPDESERPAVEHGDPRPADRPRRRRDGAPARAAPDRHADRAAADPARRPGLLRPSVRGHPAPGRGGHGVGGDVRTRRPLAAPAWVPESGRAGGFPAGSPPAARAGRDAGGRGAWRGHEPGHSRRVCPHARRCGAAAAGRGRSGGRRPADGRGPAAGLARLSPRERELVTLVAQGRTDAQIAAQLYITVRTVSSHLDRIRDKTGCRRRADLTRLALSAGLV